MARLKTQQGRSLWIKAVIQYVGALVLYTLAFVVFMLFIGLNAFADLGDRIAEETSPWSYASVAELDQLIDDKSIRTQDLQIMGVSSGIIMDYEDWESYGRALYDDMSAAADQDELKILEADGTITVDKGDQESSRVIAFRDLRFYNTLRSLKWVFVIALYIIGLLAVSLIMLRKPIRSIDAITCAIASPGLVRGEEIDLPDALQPVRSELELLQMRIVQNEMAARIANERKNELVTYLAHDIRTPMTSVMGYLDLISEADEMPAAKQREYASRAFSKATRLNGLVEELFEITRYNMQDIPIEREMLDVHLLCDQIAEEFFPLAQERAVVIEVDVDSGLMAFLDPSRMGRVLENILKNAIAHASSGSSIVVSAHAVDDDMLVVGVRNEGKEISAVHLEHIFDRFYRADEARRQDTGGAGLGLAIAKEIVEAHDGSIAVTSDHGVTEFTIRMPRE